VTTIERPHQQENRLQSDPTVAKDDVHPSSPDGRLSVATWLAAAAISAALALAALAMCEYRFGTADQLQYLANVVEIENPGALGDDPYLRAFAALRSIFWYTWRPDGGTAASTWSREPPPHSCSSCRRSRTGSVSSRLPTSS
jgi:hypothetical protein